MKTLNIIAFVLVLLGAINWLLIGLFNWSFVAAIFGAGAGTRIVYIIYAIAGLWLLGKIAHSFMKTDRISRA